MEWLRDEPEVVHRCRQGSAVFADISGFTNLTERLARRGKVGAEEMGEVLNATFEQLLDAAYAYGAGLAKWGGDAVLLLFDGDQHVERGCRAAFDMQRVMRQIGRVQTSQGMVRLRMSIGVHTGYFDFLLVGDHFRELIVTGPGATAVAEMEAVAQAGEIVVSEPTAAALAGGSRPLVGRRKGSGRVLSVAPDVPPKPRPPWQLGDGVDLSGAMCSALRDHLLEGAVEPEHRNVAVGFIQLQGADALLQRGGPDALVAAFTRFVERCQGAALAHSVTFLSSDVCRDGAKIILVSGAPTSAGDDEARLLAAVRSVLDGRGDLDLRAGVSAGRVFGGDFGPPYRRVYSIVGDIVNLAARLMGKAEPGELVATPNVVARSRTAFETLALDPFLVKGKQEPVEAVLVGPVLLHQVMAPAAATFPLIGRDAEVGALLDAARSAAAGKGRAVELVGSLGIGKSRLLEELVARTDASVLWAYGDIYGTATPYQPMQRLFRAQLGVAEEASPAEVSASLRRLIETAAPELVAWLPLIAIVAGADLGTTEEVETLDPGVRKERLEQATSDALGGLLTSPTVFVFNDLHFMDDATIGLLHRLVADVADRPWLLIASRRPDTRSPLSDIDHVTRIELGPLDAVAADELIALATASTPLSTHRVEAIVDRAAGNPLFLKELVAGVGTIDDEALPDSIEGMVAARIDRLAPPRRRLLRAASVLGMTVDLELLDGIVGAEGSERLRRADLWADAAEFVVPVDEGHLRFVHHLFRESAYEGLPYSRRAALHARAADIIERRAGTRVGDYAELLSRHSFHGKRFDAAWEYSRLAGTMARERYANVDAARCYRRALSSAQHLRNLADIEVADLCEDLSDVYIDLGEFEHAETVLRQARGRSRSHRVRTARLYLKSAEQRQLIGRYSAAVRWINRGRRVLDDESSREALQLKARLAELYAAIRYAQGHHRAAIGWAQRAISEARACNDRVTQGKALQIQNIAAAVSGQPVDAARARESLDLFRRAGDLRGLARAHTVLGMCAYYVGRWDEALVHYVASEETYVKIGRRFDAAISWANQAEILVDQNRLEEAERVLNEAMRVWKGAKAASEIPFGTYQLGRIAARLGRFDEALARYARARRDCVALGEAHEVLTIDALRAECHLLAGQAGDALTVAVAAMAEIDHLAGVVSAVPLLERVRGMALVEMAETTAGIQALRESLRAARQRDAGHEVAATLGALLSVGAADDETQATNWERERSALIADLGISDPPAGSPMARVPPRGRRHATSDSGSG